MNECMTFKIVGTLLVKIPVTVKIFVAGIVGFG